MGLLLKRFLLFQGDIYYPGSGFCDFVDSFDTREEAESHVAYRFGQAEEFRWSEIVDTWDLQDVQPVGPDSYMAKHWKEFEDAQGKD